ncbi:MAG: hypothetical protein LUG16_01745, partial [Candidatus Gastranaerophilales bacterium]|nr:hypothetical protein [Candidatus Gastranaerophilales bacterium]
VISIVMAAAMPVITRKTAQSSDQIWKWTDDNSSAWFGTGNANQVLIGTSSIPTGGGRTIVQS